MNDKERLLQKLNQLASLSIKYEQKLCSTIRKTRRRAGFKFLKKGEKVRKSWQLLRGYIISCTTDENDNLLVNEIYTKGQFFTEMRRLLNQNVAQFNFVAISDVEVFELTEIKLAKLRKHAETDQLLLAVTTDDDKRADFKEHLLSLQLEDRILSFFERYDVPDLADTYIANFLRIPLDEYLELKVNLLASGQLNMAGPDTRLPTHTFDRQTIYEVKLYLKNNYSRQDIGNTHIIALQFNTTKKTITRMFKLILGTTVHKLILKIRMEKAHALLAENSFSIKVVSEAVGYKDVYYFTKAFKKYHGISAKEAQFRGLKHGI